MEKSCSQSFVFDGVPAGADPETQAPFAEDVHLGGLLGEQCGLALRGDDDAGHELQLRDRCQEPVEDKGLVECRVDVVRPLPAGMHRWIGAENVIVDFDMPVAELLDLANVGPDGARVVASSVCG